MRDAVAYIGFSPSAFADGSIKKKIDELSAAQAVEDAHYDPNDRRSPHTYQGQIAGRLRRLQKIARTYGVTQIMLSESEANQLGLL